MARAGSRKCMNFRQMSKNQEERPRLRLAHELTDSGELIAFLVTSY